jgi:CHAT domain-containing protein
VPDDDATVTLMETFYSRLAAGDSRDEALRRAQAALAERGLAPNRWGGFEVVGDYRSLAGGR